MEKSSRMPLHYVIQNDGACYQSNDRQEYMNCLQQSPTLDYMQNMYSQIQSSEPTTVLNMVISLMHWMFYTVGYPFAAVGNFWYHPSPL